MQHFVRKLLPALVLTLSLCTCAAQDDQLPKRNTVVIRRYFDQWANHGDTTAADTLMATNLVLRNPPAIVHSLAEYKQSMAKFHAAFPDLHFTVEDIIAERDRVVVRWTLRATHLGEYQGRAPTGKRMTVTGMSLFRMSEGKIQETWVNMDRWGMMEQLGWLPDARSPSGSNR